MNGPGTGEGGSPGQDRSFRRAFRWSLQGAAVVGGVFLLVSVAQTLLTGGSVLSHLGPILAMTVIGATVGGLAGPLVGGGLARRRERRRREQESDEAG